MERVKQFQYACMALLLMLAACRKEDEPASVPTLEFATNELSVGVMGGNITIGVKADMAYEVVMPEDAAWLKYTDAAAVQAGALTLEVMKNPSPDNREAKVVIKESEGVLADTLRIEQSGIADSQDITSEFDPGFAVVLKILEFIPNASKITYADVKDIEALSLSELDLASLRGIEYLTSLKFLNVNENRLTELNVSRNAALTTLWCGQNQLTALDVSRNTALKTLNCSSNPLATLDVSRNAVLAVLNCSKNQLTELDVSQNIALTDLWCTNNQLTTLDLSKNTLLETLFCSYNPWEHLDLSNNIALERLDFCGCPFSILDVARNVNLEWLDCADGELMSLDLSQNKALNRLYCSNNQLATLDVSQNTALTELECFKNPGRDGIFELTVWPDSELEPYRTSWDYEGQTVNVKIVEKNAPAE